MDSPQPFKVIRGVVHLGEEIAGPGDIVADADSEGLPVLGQARIDALIEDGTITYDLTADAISPPLSDADRTSARAAARSARGEA